MSRALASAAVAVLGLALAGAGCERSVLPVPATGPHTGELPIIVPYPPPPAKVEVIPAAPSTTAVWVDGEWQWRTGRWVWTPGSWQKPPAVGYFAPPKTYGLSDGTLAHYAGTWHTPAVPTASGAASAAPPPRP